MSDKCDSCSTGCSSGQCSDPEERLPPGMLSRYDINGSVADGVLIWIELMNGKIPKNVLETIEMAKSLGHERIYGILFGDISRKTFYDELFEYGVGDIYHIRSAELNEFHPEAYAEAVKDVAERIDPAVILIPATSRGKELAPRTAAILEAGFAADCSKISIENGTATVISGDVTKTASLPLVMTIPEGIFSIPSRKEGMKGTAINRQFKGTMKNIIERSL